MEASQKITCYLVNNNTRLQKYTGAKREIEKLRKRKNPTIDRQKIRSLINNDTLTDPVCGAVVVPPLVVK